MDRPAGPPLLPEDPTELIALAADKEDFARAEHLLSSTLALNPEDPPGGSRYLLGLACFHQEHWAEAESHFARVPSVAARSLAEQARCNAATHAER